MSDFDEAEFDAMTDEALADYLAHDAEPPLSFARRTEAVLYAAAVLAARSQAKNVPRSASRTALKPVTHSVPGKLSPSVLSPLLTETDDRTSPQYTLTAKTVRPLFKSAASRLLIAPLALAAGLAIAYSIPAIRPDFTQHVFSTAPVSSPSAGSGACYRLTWVPDDYVPTDFPDWDVTGYLYAWKNDAGAKITFCRYLGGTSAVANRNNADVTAVPVCGCVSEYIRKGPWRSLVFSDADGRNVYYLDAENVFDAEMQKMIASIR